MQRQGQSAELLALHLHDHLLNERAKTLANARLDRVDTVIEKLRRLLGRWLHFSTNLAGAELVIGLLSPGTTESNYVLAELGAAWGHDVTTFPLLARGATYADVPSPLNERH
jgi:hypothetical protein